MAGQNSCVIVPLDVQTCGNIRQYSDTSLGDLNNEIRGGSTGVNQRVGRLHKKLAPYHLGTQK